MAQDIAFTGWTGTNNKDELWELKLPTKDDPRSDLSATQNIILDDKGLPSVRDGYTRLVSVSGAHSGFSAYGVFVYVKGGTLYRFYPGPKTSVPLLGVGSDSVMRYWAAAGRFFFTNGVVVGEVVNGVAALFTLPSSEFKSALLPGQAIAFSKGRLYTFAGSILCESDHVHLARMDMEKGFKQFPEQGRVIAPTTDGMYAGTEKGVYYGSGGILGKMAFIKVADYPAKDVPVQYVEASRIKGLNIEGRFPLICTDGGVCVGLPQGQILNVTESKYEMPAGTTGASMVREIGGQKHYISVYR